MIHRCNKALKKILDGDRNGAEKDKKANTFMEALSDMFPDTHDTADLIRRLAQQGGKMMEIHRRAKELQTSLPQEEASFLYAQIIYPSGLHRCFCRCEQECQLALQAFQTNDEEAIQNHLRNAHHALAEYAELIPEYLTGQYVHWYDGCQKVDYRTVVEKLNKLLI